jgi:pimeloyl-ACP methyl ester carboxylesterase
MQSSSQTTSDRVNLNTVDTGKGHPIVFLHGFPLSSGAWHKQIEVFRLARRVIAPDLRGFGSSATVPGPTTMSQYAGDVHQLIERLAADPVVLVGHSMGGYVALAFALEFPQMLRGLVLVSTNAGSDTAEKAAARHATAEKVKAEGVSVVIDAMTPKMLAPGNQNAGTVERARKMMSSSQPEGVIGALLGMAERPDVTAQLAQIAVPTLIITGANDALIPRTESEKLNQGIPHSQLSVIPRAGHLVAFERPEDFNRVLLDWLNSSPQLSPTE